MTSERIATLHVQLDAQTAKFQREIGNASRKVERETDKMRRSVQTTSNRISSMGAALGGVRGALAAGLGTAGIVNFGRQALDAADRIDKLSISTGLSVVTLQRLRFAAEQTGAGADFVSNGFQRFNRRLGEFRNSGAGPAKGALEALGLAGEIASGEIGTTEEALRMVMEHLAEMPDKSQQAAAAAKLFGDDAGPGMVKLLSEGIEGINAYGDRLETLGGVMDRETIAKSVAAKDRMNELFTVLETRGVAAVGQFAPVIEATGTLLLEFINLLGQAVSAMDALDRTANENLGALGRLWALPMTGVLGILPREQIDGARATGGPVTGGKTYLVGERGPELFQPSASGTVIPNNRLREQLGRAQVGTRSDASAVLREVLAGLSGVAIAAQGASSATRALTRQRAEEIDLQGQMIEALPQAADAVLGLARSSGSAAEKMLAIASLVLQGLNGQGAFGQILGPLANIAGSAISGAFGGSSFAPGLSFGSGLGSSGVTAFAKGGVVSSPTTFPVASGGLGIMGEAGPEAIMPLQRGPGGRLGVAAATGPAQITVNVTGVTDADSFVRSEPQIARSMARAQRMSGRRYD
ncbi:MAG: hypothetical protein AAGF76_02985 [Pseudomonadota bacterium]